MEFECFQSLENSLEEIELLAKAADGALKNSTETSVGNTMTRAGLVLLCGLFEGFVRELSGEFVDAVNDNSLTLHSLPDPVFCTVVEKLVAQYRRDDLCFKDSISPGKFAKLERRNFSNTGGNPTVDTIEKIFGGLGIPRVVDRLTVQDYSVETTFLFESAIDLSMRSQLQAAIDSHAPSTSKECFDKVVALIDKKWTPKQKRRQVGYVSEIEQLLTKRNRIAHGEGGEQITPKDLRDFLEMVRRFAKGLHDLTSDLLAKLTVPPG